MGSQRVTTYEVLVLQGSRWEIHARYSVAERDAAISEAKYLDKTSGIGPVKVVKETFNPDEGTADELLIYKSPRLKPVAGAKSIEARPAPRRAAPSRAPAPTRSASRNAQAGAARRAENQVENRQRRGSSSWGIISKLLLITVFSICVASLLTGIGSFGLREFSDLNAKAQSNTLFGIFVLTFLLAGGAMAFVFLSKEELGDEDDFLPHLPKNGDKKGNGDGDDDTLSVAKALKTLLTAQTPEKTLDQTVNSAVIAALGRAPEPDPEPVPEPEPQSEGPVDLLRGEPETLVQRRTVGVATVEAAANPVELPKPKALEPLTHQAEERKLLMMKFLGQAVEALRGLSQKMDNFQRFGLNLFLAGACDALSQNAKLDDNDRLSILVHCVSVLGVAKQQALTFAEKHEEYLLADQRYLAMFAVGKDAMTAYLAGDETAARQIVWALKEWSKPRQRDAAPEGPVTVMFTDMVGSTDMTQQMGDAVAQEVVRTHNRIVRAALNETKGREIKHTGDGIMASFTTPVLGVNAAIAIMRGVEAHNKVHPHLPLHLRVGINTGHLITEDNDLFGSTVQMASRLCSHAATDQILISADVKSGCPENEYLIADHGLQSLKGFKDPLEIHQVLWPENAKLEDALPPAGGIEVASEEAPAAQPIARPRKAAPKPPEPEPAPQPEPPPALEPQPQAATVEPTEPAGAIDEPAPVEAIPQAAAQPVPPAEPATSAATIEGADPDQHEMVLEPPAPAAAQAPASPPTEAAPEPEDTPEKPPQAAEKKVVSQKAPVPETSPPGGA